MTVLLPNLMNLQEAAHCLKTDRLVVFPTETVYGLGANATSSMAVAQIFALKQRPSFNPLIVHFSTLESTNSWVVWNKKVLKLAQAFWPGPLTLVLPKKKNSKISPLVSAGLDTVAIRVPHHPVAQELLQLAGCPVAAPSANRSGLLSPTQAMHVVQSLQAPELLIIDGGTCSVGLESTVVDVSQDIPVLLRPGGITLEKIQSVVGECEVLKNAPSEKVKSPGLLLKHYAPRIPIRINVHEVFPDEALLAFGPHSFLNLKKELNLSFSKNLIEAASHLFEMLHALDQPEFSAIAVMPIPEVGLGIAINDRLRRASFR